MRIKVASIGREKAGIFAPGVSEYTGRLGHFAKIQLVELAPSPRSGDEAREEEADKLLGEVGPRDTLVVLDERGTQFTSVELSRWLGKQLETGKGLVFAIGGDEGLADRVRQKAALVWSLSKLTFPHRMAKVLMLEQVYRAFTIVKGLPYHK
jgi:23S rRNA (pseudouridine1915-N3)-methyltransferase